MRKYIECPTVRRKLQDGNIIEMTFTSATHVHVSVPGGFKVRDKAYHTSAHLFLKENGSWDITGTRTTGPGLFCPEAPPSYKAKISDALVEQVAAFVNGPDGRGVLVMAEQASCNNEIVRLEAHEIELRTKLHETLCRIAIVTRLEDKALTNVLPTFYVEGL